MTAQYSPVPHSNSHFVTSTAEGMSTADPWMTPAAPVKGWSAANLSSQPTNWTGSWTQPATSEMSMNKIKEMSSSNSASAALPAGSADEPFFYHIRPGQRWQSWDQFVVNPQTQKKSSSIDSNFPKSERSIQPLLEAGGEIMAQQQPQRSAEGDKDKLPWTVLPSGAPVPRLVDPTTPPSSTPPSPTKTSPIAATPPTSPSKKDDAAAAAAAALAASRRNSEIEQELQQQSLYKTELCRSWAETGICRYGTKCQFAHGVEELRPVMRHPKYKTEICRTFHTLGTCPYGTRCRFIHNRDGVLPPEWSTEIQRARSMSQPAFMPAANSQASVQQNSPAPQAQPQQQSQPAAAALPQRSASVDYSAPLPAAADLLTQRFGGMSLATMSWEVPPAQPPVSAGIAPSPNVPAEPLEEEKPAKGSKRKSRLPFFERLTVKKKDKESSRSK